jgi:hypothetical protein
MTVHTARKSGYAVIAVVFAALFVLHQDVWFWTDRRIVLGFLPIGLAYHMGFSLATAGLWWLATRIAWPESLETWASTPPGDDPPDPGPERRA